MWKAFLVFFYSDLRNIYLQRAQFRSIFEVLSFYTIHDSINSNMIVQNQNCILVMLMLMMWKFYLQSANVFVKYP